MIFAPAIMRTLGQSAGQRHCLNRPPPRPLRWPIPLRAQSPRRSPMSCRTNFLRKKNAAVQPASYRFGDPGKKHRRAAVRQSQPRPGQRLFREGVQDEILTRLAKVADLKVISRTSTQQFKSAPDNLAPDREATRRREHPGRERAESRTTRCASMCS